MGYAGLGYGLGWAELGWDGIWAGHWDVLGWDMGYARLGYGLCLRCDMGWAGLRCDMGYAG